MPRTRNLPRVLFGAVLAIVALAAVASNAQAKRLPAEWTWTDYGPALRDVSCPSAGHCVGVGQRGMVLRSTSGGDDSLAWSQRVPLEYPEELDGVTCTGSLCLAVSNTRTLTATYVSKVFRSTNGGSTWSDGVALPAAGPSKTRSALAIDCAGAASCYAAGPGGGVWRSADGGGSWGALELPDKSAAYERIDCPAAGVCVVAGNQKAKGKSTGGVAIVEGTKVTPVDLPAASGDGVLAVGCDTGTSCTVTDGLGHYMSLSIPKQKFESVGLLPKSLAVSSLSCPKQGECVGLSKGLGVAVSSTNVGAADVVWRRRPIGSTKLAALSCADDGCVAVGNGAGWFAGSENGRQWKRVNEVAKFEAIQCESLPGETCVAGGKDMIGLSGTGGKFWSQPMSDDMLLEIKSLDCNGRTDCLFLGKTMTLFSRDLITFEGRHPTTTFPSGTDAQTCITHQICVGAGAGVVYTTLDAATSEWTQNGLPGKAGAIGCVPGRTDPAECLVTVPTAEVMLLGTMTHDNGKIRWNWRYADIEPVGVPKAIDCSRGGECTAVGTEGRIYSSQGSDLMHWNELILPTPSTPVEELPDFESVSCPADGVCIAGGLNGNTVYISSTKNDWSDWTFEEIEGIEGEKPTISAFGCETVDRCVGVGGSSLVGVRK